MKLLVVLSVIALAMLPFMKAKTEDSKSGKINVRKDLPTSATNVVIMGHYFPLSNWLKCLGMEVDHGTHKPQPKNADNGWFAMPILTQLASMFGLGSNKLKSLISRINIKFGDFHPKYTEPKYKELKREIAEIVGELQDIYKSSSGQEKAESKMILEDLHTGLMLIEANLCQQEWWFPAAKEAGKSFPVFAISQKGLEGFPLLTTRRKY